MSGQVGRVIHWLMAYWVNEWATNEQVSESVGNVWASGQGDSLVDGSLGQ
jgi:hypothetical protein